MKVYLFIFNYWTALSTNPNFASVNLSIVKMNDTHWLLKKKIKRIKSLVVISDYLSAMSIYWLNCWAHTEHKLHKK